MKAKTKIFSTGIAIVMIAAVVLAIVSENANSANTHQSPSNLSISLLTTSGESGTTTKLAISITNSGSAASGVSVILQSDAFNQISTKPENVDANSSITVEPQAAVNQVQIGNHKVEISYQYSGSKEINAGQQNFYVTPSIQIADAQWPRQFYNLGGLGEKSTIKPKDTTTFYFKIQNEEPQTCTGLTATATLPAGSIGLITTPTSLTLDPLGPQGTSKQYSFGFTSNSTPTGTYNFVVTVYSDGYEAYSKTFTIWVAD